MRPNELEKIGELFRLEFGSKMESPDSALLF